MDFECFFFSWRERTRREERDSRVMCVMCSAGGRKREEWGRIGISLLGFFLWIEKNPEMRTCVFWCVLLRLCSFSFPCSLFFLLREEDESTNSSRGNNCRCDGNHGRAATNHLCMMENIEMEKEGHTRAHTHTGTNERQHVGTNQFDAYTQTRRFITMHKTNSYASLSSRSCL